ncbi:hypothetical protein DL96DRAFT_486682 [Flagelloscypha sp. PMI_526]|nr:hypothetical protein DL96DRAFT_486682 [Flagelloscypha sp. PMI_526]
MHASRGIKKTHRKTKTGCKTCRQRRVKCDEEKPECFNCQRRGVDCLWGENAVVPLPTTCQGPATNTTPSTQVATSCGLAMSDMLGIELMHHYMAYTSVSLMSEATDEHTINFLRLAVPRAALRCPPLMAMMFALTTMHIHVAEHRFPEPVSQRSYLDLSEDFAASALRDGPINYDVNIYDPQEREPIYILNSFLSLVSMSHPNFQLASFSPGLAVDPAYIYVDHPFSWLAATRHFQAKAMQRVNSLIHSNYLFASFILI